MNWKLWLQAAQAFMTLLGKLPGLLMAVEEAIPGEGKGEQKLKLIRVWLEETFGMLDDIEVSFDDLWPRLQSAIGATVKLFNELGIFSKPKG